MKRALACLGFIVAAVLAPVGSAQAQAADCEFELPGLPGECVTESVYNYVIDLRDDNIAQRIRASNAEADAQQLREQMWQLATDLTAARAATVTVTVDRDIALEQIGRLNVRVDGLETKVARLQTTVKVLKKRIKKLEAQLPYSAA